MSIKNIDSAPEHITEFINNNTEQLSKIYDEGISSNEDGILVCKCSKEDNRIDVQFMNDDMFSEIITRESWIPFKESIPKDKRMLFIQDLDLNCVFIIYI